MVISLLSVVGMNLSQVELPVGMMLISAMCFFLFNSMFFGSCKSRNKSQIGVGQTQCELVGMTTD